MSNRKEVNPFSIAFLDLMSSALAAVIILFVIVPKSDIQIDIAETAFSDMKSGFEEVDSIIMSWASFMSEEEIAFILSKTDQLQINLREAEEASRITQVRLDETKQRNEQLNMRLTLAEKKIAQMEKEATPAKKASTSAPSKAIAEQKSQDTPTTEKTTKSKDANPFETDGQGDYFFGIEAPLVTMITWEDAKYDVTLHLKDERGMLCDYYSRKTSFGQWVKIPRKFISTPSQAIIQNELAPGSYEVHAHLRRPRRGDAITISGFAAITPENGSAKKVDFGEVSISPGPAPHKSGANTLIGTLIVTENDIRFNKA